MENEKEVKLAPEKSEEIQRNDESLQNLLIAYRTTAIHHKTLQQSRIGLDGTRLVYRHYGNTLVLIRAKHQQIKTYKQSGNNHQPTEKAAALATDKQLLDGIF